MVKSIGKLAGVGNYLADCIERKMGDWESIEMVQRYAHLAPEHLSQHARLIDSGFAPGIGGLVQNFAKVQKGKIYTKPKTRLN